jgi:hypothetical protein
VEDRPSGASSSRILRQVELSAAFACPVRPVATCRNGAVVRDVLVDEAQEDLPTAICGSVPDVAHVGCERRVDYLGRQSRRLKRQAPGCSSLAPPHGTSYATEASSVDPRMNEGRRRSTLRAQTESLRSPPAGISVQKGREHSRCPRPAAREVGRGSPPHFPVLRAPVRSEHPQFAETLGLAFSPQIAFPAVLPSSPSAEPSHALPTCEAFAGRADRGLFYVAATRY